MINKATLHLLCFDLYYLRYEKDGDQWYELTDYLREKLVEDGVKISYDDNNRDLLFSIDYSPIISMKKQVERIRNENKG